MEEGDLDQEASQKLIDADIKRFNKQFYEDFDHQYFFQKCVYLTTLLAKPEMLENALKDGIDFETLKMQMDGKVFDNTFGKSYKQSLKTEISVTYYHAIETLFRLIFAHSVNTNCPWVELATQNDFKKFKKNVEDFSNKEYFKDHTKGVASLFFGSEERADFKDITKKQWEDSVKNLDNFLTNFAKDLLKSYGYNNYKHGLTLFPSQLGFTLSDAANNPEKTIKVDTTDTHVFLTHEVDKERKGFRQLFINHQFIDWQHQWAMVYYITGFIESILLIGAWKHDGQPHKTRTYEELDYMQVIKINKKDFQPSNFKMSSFSFRIKKK